MVLSIGLKPKYVEIADRVVCPVWVTDGDSVQPNNITNGSAVLVSKQTNSLGQPVWVPITDAIVFDGTLASTADSKIMLAFGSPFFKAGLGVQVTGTVGGSPITIVADADSESTMAPVVELPLKQIDSNNPWMDALSEPATNETVLMPFVDPLLYGAVFEQNVLDATISYAGGGNRFIPLSSSLDWQANPNMLMFDGITLAESSATNLVQNIWSTPIGATVSGWVIENGTDLTVDLSIESGNLTTVANTLKMLVRNKVGSQSLAANSWMTMKTVSPILVVTSTSFAFSMYLGMTSLTNSTAIYQTLLGLRCFDQQGNLLSELTWDAAVGWNNKLQYVGHVFDTLPVGTFSVQPILKVGAIGSGDALYVRSLLPQLVSAATYSTPILGLTSRLGDVWKAALPAKTSWTKGTITVRFQAGPKSIGTLFDMSFVTLRYDGANMVMTTTGSINVSGATTLVSGTIYDATIKWDSTLHTRSISVNGATVASDAVTTFTTPTSAIPFIGVGCTLGGSDQPSVRLVSIGVYQT